MVCFGCPVSEQGVGVEIDMERFSYFSDLKVLFGLVLVLCFS